jgi:hypothetical protein
MEWAFQAPSEFPIFTNTCENSLFFEMKTIKYNFVALDVILNG